MSSYPNRETNSAIFLFILTFIGALTDVEEQVHDEVQVHLLIIKAVVVSLKQLLVLSAELPTGWLYQGRLVQLTCLQRRAARVCKRIYKTGRHQNLGLILRKLCACIELPFFFFHYLCIWEIKECWNLTKRWQRCVQSVTTTLSNEYPSVKIICYWHDYFSHCRKIRSWQ